VKEYLQDFGLGFWWMTSGLRYVFPFFVYLFWRHHPNKNPIQ